MNEKREFFPSPKGLIRDQLNQLTRFADDLQNASLADLHLSATQHVELARQMHAKNPFVNARFAEAIGRAIDSVVTEWDHFPQDTQYWFKGAIQYFVHSADGEPDFGSVIGFDDDAEVLNACLQLAGKQDWCLKPEDYDDA